jgi:hypothetical protein
VPGIVRTYTFIPGKFTLPKAAQAAVAGRTFVTTGPLLLATMDGSPPGSAFRAGQKERSLAIEAWASGEDSQGLERLEILRNGRPYREIGLPGHPLCVQTNIVLREAETAWYCVRVLGSVPQRQAALSGAFYFAERSYHPPAPVRPQVRARLVDAQSGKPVSGTLTEVAFAGTFARDGKRHILKTGEGRLWIPGTVRLRAEATGYQPEMLSPFFDNPPLVELVTRLSAEDLVKWETFEKIRGLLSDVPLTFKLRRLDR